MSRVAGSAVARPAAHFRRTAQALEDVADDRHSLRVFEAGRRRARSAAAATRRVSTSVVAKPVSTDCSFHRLRTRRPAPPAARERSRPAPRPGCCGPALARPGHALPDDFKCSLTSVRADWRAGRSRPAGRRHCGQHREQEHALINGDVGDSRQPIRHQPQQQIDAPQTRQESDGAGQRSTIPSTSTLEMIRQREAPSAR